MNGNKDGASQPGTNTVEIQQKHTCPYKSEATDFPNFSHFIATALQKVCKNDIPFNESVQFTGNLFMTIDQSNTFDFLVNENILKSNTENFTFLSNSCQIFVKQELTQRGNQLSGDDDEQDKLQCYMSVKPSLKEEYLPDNVVSASQDIISSHNAGRSANIDVTISKVPKTNMWISCFLCVL